MASLFRLPDDLLASLFLNFPCRETQINTLATLIHPSLAPCRKIVVHGTEATGKSAVVDGLLQALHSSSEEGLDYAIVKSAECITARHLFERTVSLVHDARINEAADANRPGRCETLAALTAELTKMLKYPAVEGRDNGERTHPLESSRRGERTRRFVLVFDSIDRQRDAPHMLLPGLARLSEIIPNLTTVFIVTTPSSPTNMRLPPSSAPHVHFSAYTKSEYLSILSRDPLPLPFNPTLSNNTTATDTTQELWTRFAAAVHDSLGRPAARTLPRLRRACEALWPRFVAPIASGTHKPTEFSRLLVAARRHFQDEGAVEPGIQWANNKHILPTPTPTAVKNQNNNTDLSSLLPPTARRLLIAAYLASHNAPRHDVSLFSTWHDTSKRRRHRGTATTGGSGSGMRGGKRSSSRHRRIARKLLGPGVFVLERMVAIYVALRGEWDDINNNTNNNTNTNTNGRATSVKPYAGVDADVAMAIATLASLRLLVRVGGGAGTSVGLGGGGGGGGGADLDRGGKWRVNVSWDIIRAVGRSMGIEVEEWLVE
ncbi:origin recognition complex subunit Orc5 [Xylariaceae sp. FL0594]|nr:origin recognition complex subunit Orc5 [Xylariaceae sp. FL0594]